MACPPTPQAGRSAPPRHARCRRRSGTGSLIHGTERIVSRGLLGRRRARLSGVAGFGNLFRRRILMGKLIGLRRFGIPLLAAGPKRQQGAEQAGRKSDGRISHRNRSRAAATARRTLTGAVPPKLVRLATAASTLSAPHIS